MVRTRALRFLLILGLVALLIPVSLAQADSHGGSGTAIVRDAVILGDPFAGDLPMEVASGMLILSMSEVPVPEENTALEGWLISDDGERNQSIGILEVSEDGTVNHEFVADPGENLLLGFNTFVVTLEQVPDDDPGPSADVTHRTILVPEVLEQIRLLLDTTGPAATVNLVDKAEMTAAQARLAQAAVSNGDLEMTKAHLATMTGIVAGSGEDAGIAALADLVVSAATMAGEAAGGDETVVSASEATVAAANSAKASAEEAVAQAALVSAATSTQVAALYMNNVVAEANGAAEAAQMAYTGTQDLGTYAVAAPTTELPDTGEPIVPLMVRYGLIASIVLALLGSVMFFATRRRSSASAA